MYKYHENRDFVSLVLFCISSSYNKTWHDVGTQRLNESVINNMRKRWGRIEQNLCPMIVLGPSYQGAEARGADGEGHGLGNIR